MGKDENWEPSNPNVLFDLRQTYAMKILTPILEELEVVRTKNDYRIWWELLTTHLYVNVHQKLSDDERTEFDLKEKETMNVLNKYPNVFKGMDRNPEGTYLIKKSLMTLEMWLKNKMEEKGLYGKGSEYDWDEI